MKRSAFVSFSCACVLYGASVGGAQEAFRVVVHPQVKGTQIPRAALSSIFLRQAKKWGDGTAVLPVDQSLRAQVRSAFSHETLGKSLLEVQVFWQRQIANGLTPPPVKASDDEVLAYVASTPGAIGYVSARARVPQSVKAVEITD